MKGILSALRECEMGGPVLAKATCLLQESSKDGVADEKIQLAIKQLEDKRLPGLVRTEAEGAVHATVSNFHLLSGMAVVDTLEESLQNVAEACEICSPIALERNSGAINDWLMKIIGCLTFYDGCLATYAQALTSGGGLRAVALAGARHRRPRGNGSGGDAEFQCPRKSARFPRRPG
ncbi:unnamed protein product [Prorocentrum cordatum]|uniref:Uncharacterized protein n=1 Tax=Prorocentrum cordatum TaxID=2364126 RepID=A0ABN9PKP5_9DINO|nr:unnamed protein product [Polarella glacialis]